MAAHLVGLVAHYGYALIALFLFGEGLAIPFPTDTTVVTASALAAHGHLSLGLVFLVSTLSTSAGTTAAFYLGRRGSNFIARRAHGGAGTLARAHRFFERHGTSAVLFGRFVPVVRMLISVVAGVSQMDARRFALYNLAGAAIWASAFCAIGYFFGHHASAFYHQLVRAALVAGFGLAALVTLAVAGGWLIEDVEATWRAEGTIWHRILMSRPVRWLGARSPRAQAILFRRFSPADYLGLNLTLGLGVCFVLLLVFAAIAQSVLSKTAIFRFDLDLASALHAGVTPAGIAVAIVVSRLGTISSVAVLGAGAALWYASRRGWLALAGWLAALAGGEVLAWALKHAIHRERPVFEVSYATEHTFSFPSSHVLVALVGYGMIAYFVVCLTNSRLWRGVVIALAGLLVLAVGYSRMYLGLHFFSDVVGGLAAGAVWLTTCITALEVARRKQEAIPRGAAARHLQSAHGVKAGFDGRARTE
ncbi:MAG TPA: bifunctional DedA family/phosphatase PAP2 family protein [Gemmatimonadaceae bacterium]|nr:bifunctional DedA family/phosphatase PAP2 family protein [Gemmatimonadaceae bacterium]